MSLAQQSNCGSGGFWWKSFELQPNKEVEEEREKMCYKTCLNNEQEEEIKMNGFFSLSCVRHTPESLWNVNDQTDFIDVTHRMKIHNGINSVILLLLLLCMTVGEWKVKHLIRAAAENHNKWKTTTRKTKYNNHRWIDSKVMWIRMRMMLCCVQGVSCVGDFDRRSHSGAGDGFWYLTTERGGWFSQFMMKYFRYKHEQVDQPSHLHFICPDSLTPSSFLAFFRSFCSNTWKMAWL